MLRDSGGKAYETLANNIREVRRALDEMVEMGTLASSEVEPRKEGRRIVDALFTLQVSSTFTGEMIESNKIQLGVRYNLGPADSDEQS